MLGFGFSDGGRGVVVWVGGGVRFDESRSVGSWVNG